MTAVMPKIIIKQSQWREIQFYVDKCPMEISGMGNVIIDPDGNFRITRLAMLEQEVSSASTDIEPKAIAKLMGELRNEEGTLSFWWHSHVNMTAFFSGTDEATILDHGKNGYCIALVINKRGEYKTAYCQKTPFLKIDDMQLVIEDDSSEARKALIAQIAVLDKDEMNAKLEAWNDEYEAKVKTRTYDMGRTIGYGGRFNHELGVWEDDEGFAFMHGCANDTAVNPLHMKGAAKRKLNKAEKVEYKKLYKDFYGFYPMDDQELEEFFMDFNDIQNKEFYGTAKTSKSNKTAGHRSPRNIRERN